MNMKKVFLTVAVLSASFGVFAETVHQKAAGDKAYFDKSSKIVEYRKVEGSTGNQILRMKPEMVQWGYITYWMGIPTPEGKSIIRLRIYNDGTDTASYAVYARSSKTNKLIKKIVIPEDAKKDSFITLDFPVSFDEEWSGIVIKKFDKSNKPSPWIDSVSVVLPD